MLEDKMIASYSDLTTSMKNYCARNSSNPPNISRPPRPQKEEKGKTFKNGLRPID